MTARAKIYLILLAFSLLCWAGVIWLAQVLVRLAMPVLVWMEK